MLVARLSDGRDGWNTSITARRTVVTVWVPSFLSSYSMCRFPRPLARRMARTPDVVVLRVLAQYKVIVGCSFWSFIEGGAASLCIFPMSYFPPYVVLASVLFFLAMGSGVVVDGAPFCVVAVVSL